MSIKYSVSKHGNVIVLDLKVVILRRNIVCPGLFKDD